MNIMINASNIRKSGALQVTLSFLEEVKKITRHNYLIAVSEEVERQIDITSFPSNCTVLPLSTGTPLSRGFLRQIKKLGEAERKFGADCVFSVFAPAYWTPTAKHLVGFASVWAINPDSAFIKSLPLKERIKTSLGNAFRNYFTKRNTIYHVVEEDDVKTRLSRYLGIDKRNIYVVNNTYNHHFDEPSALLTATIKFPEKIPGQFSLVTISSNFLHKNLSIIPAVSKELKSKGHNDIYFYLTIKQPEFEVLANGDENIKNLGVVAASDCPYVYSQSDAMLLPTMLECFSASYPEAMVMKKPILTSDLSFARSICGDAAIYFDPFNPADIAEKIIRLKTDKTMYDTLVANGTKKVKSFPTAFERASRYIEICEEIMEKP